MLATYLLRLFMYSIACLLSKCCGSRRILHPVLDTTCHCCSERHFNECAVPDWNGDTWRCPFSNEFHHFWTILGIIFRITNGENPPLVMERCQMRVGYPHPLQDVWRGLKLVMLLLIQIFDKPRLLDGSGPCYCRAIIDELAKDSDLSQDVQDTE